MHFNEYSFLLLACGCIAVLISVIIFGRVGPAVRSYAYLTLFIAVWSLGYAFELASPDYESMRMWVNVEYIGISFLPALFLLFIVRFIGKEEWITPRRLIYLFIFPCLTLLMVWTDPWHHLHYSEIYIDRTGLFPMLHVKIGIWYTLHTIFFYVIILLSFYLLIRTFYKADNIYRRQNFVIILGAGIPWIVNILYILGIRPIKNLDLTPYAFLATSLIIGIGLLRFRLFDIVPIARDKVIEELGDGVLVLDQHDQIVDLNSSMKKILQRNSKGRYIGKDFIEFLPEETVLHSLVQKRIDIKHELHVEWLGETKHYEVKLNPLFDQKTVFSGLILTFSDITERKKADEVLKKQAKALEELNQLKDRLFSIISHDLRGPILSLNEIMKLLADNVIAEKDFKNYIPLLSTNIKSSSALLENLLYWSKSQLKGEQIKPRRLLLSHLVQQQIEFLAGNAEAKNISIENKIKPSSFVFADAVMVELVFRNLLSNAIKFSNQHGKVLVYGEEEGNYFVLCVEDQGLGISEENRLRLFGKEHFSNPGTNNEPGTGLGLLLCKEFVEKNGGTISVESSLGKGSIFKVSLPRHQF